MRSEAHEQKNTALKRIHQIFTFLKMMEQHRNPVIKSLPEHPWRQWLGELPSHPCMKFDFPIEESGDSAEAAPPSSSDGGAVILRVRRPSITPAPPPPKEFFEWIKSKWDDPFQDIEFHKTLETRKPDNTTELETLENDPLRLRSLEQWQTNHAQWAKAERPARETMKLYERLYLLYGQLEREGDQWELMLGDGLLDWRTQMGSIYHPILLQRVKLSFLTKVPEFVIMEEDTPVELFTAIFKDAPTLDGEVIARSRSEVEELGVAPLLGSKTDQFLKSLAVRLSSKGEFLGNQKLEGQMDYPRLARSPVLFLRSRSLGYAQAIQSVLDDLHSRPDIPESLSRLVGIEPSPITPGETAVPNGSWSAPEDILFSLEANREQVKIARDLEQTRAVVVQGPPGTGKTHTIANLIGHLLAKGQSVLVTSHTSKALTVLRDKVAEPLRPLCLSVLGSDTESRGQLKLSVEEIVERLSLDAGLLGNDALVLEKTRVGIISRLNMLRKELNDCRNGEYKPIVIAGESFDPSEAARKVAKEKEQHDWLPGPLPPDSPPPLSMEELKYLYQSNHSFSAEDEMELSQLSSFTEALPPPETFSSMADKERKLLNKNTTHGEEFWDSKPAPNGAEHAILEDAWKRVKGILKELESIGDWKRHIIEACARGGEHLRPWKILLEDIHGFVTQSGEAIETTLRYAPVLSSRFDLENNEKISGEIISHLEAGKTIGVLHRHLLRREWKEFIRASLISGKPPSQLAHFKALNKEARLKNREEDVLTLWERLAVPIGLPRVKPGNTAAIQLEERGKDLRGAIRWYDEAWDKTRIKMQELGFAWNRFERDDTGYTSSTPRFDGMKALLEKLPDIIVARFHASLKATNLQVRAGLERQVSSMLEAAPRSPLLQYLANAVKKLDLAMYKKAYQYLQHLQKQSPIYKRRIALLNKLAQAAPAWNAAIAKRQGVHGGAEIPGDAQEAWIWRQLLQELDRRNKVSIETIQQKIEKETTELRRITADLIEKKAWASQIGKMNLLKNKQALVGWLDIESKIPKTSTVPGKIARLRKQSRETMQLCKDSVPVWIMPLSRIMESFDFSKTRFDTVIIDEASQVDLMGLVAFYLARNVLVVGDHEQVSPSAIGKKEDEIMHLQETYLRGIPSHTTYDGKTSIYQLARRTSSGNFCLKEHFRCMPRIIQFSNDLSYDGKIKPLRDLNSAVLKPNVIAYPVEPIPSAGKTNIAEAETIATLIAACIEQPEYRDLSFGVISLVSEQEQVLAIERLLHAHISPELYLKHRIVCGIPAQFQGDERSVIFLSMVDMPKDGPLPLRQQQNIKQRFNVAASRAKDQLWVVYSLDPDRDLKPGDLRRRLIKHAQNPDALVKKLDRAEHRSESEFEKRVAQRLIRAGYKVRHQWAVGYYRIDLVVEGGGKRLAVECDGDRYHPPEKLREDLERQATLERLGWQFARIRGSLFFRDPDRAMEPVFEAIERIGIPPEEGKDEEAAAMDEKSNALAEKIRRRAAELRREWKTGKPSAPVVPVPSPTLSTEFSKGSAGTQTETKQSIPGEYQEPVPAEPLTKNDSHKNEEHKTSRKKTPQKSVKKSKKDSPKKDEKKPSELVLPNKKSQVWYAISQWAKIENIFQGWERSLLYNIGRNLSTGRELSDKQHKHAVRLYNEAFEQGFTPDEIG